MQSSRHYFVRTRDLCLAGGRAFTWGVVGMVAARVVEAQEFVAGNALVVGAPGIAIAVGEAGDEVGARLAAFESVWGSGRRRDEVVVVDWLQLESSHGKIRRGWHGRYVCGDEFVSGARVSFFRGKLLLFETLQVVFRFEQSEVG
ncbi:hypothetical protein GJ744_003270 [Endocarpon pusillum]|uniref:Uncharacterized protein n=1 Tax=Endocarpon pusillum TaxID=364733 RepID=A0A8H7A746_9EURO|nr:hypothetical protein GJ744_003270 [Endocarpon pusillum]